MSLEDYLDRNPATVGLLRWFEYGHLPPYLQEVSRPVAELAFAMVDALPDDPELTTGLRKLLEAKDALVRAAITAGPTMTRSGSVTPRTGPDRPDPGQNPGPRGHERVTPATAPDELVEQAREVAELDAAGVPEQHR